MGAMGRGVGVVAHTRWDQSRRVDKRGQMSSCVATSLATVKHRSWRLELSSSLSVRISASWPVTVSSWLVMTTNPETVTRRMERIEPSPAIILWRAGGERSWTKWGLGGRRFLVSENIYTRKGRVRDVRTEGDGDMGSR